jgi:choline dehydrogenase
MDGFRGEELQPGPDVSSDDEIDRWVRANVESAYHPCGTCRMGPSGSPDSVVDTACRLIGFEGLRIVDASVFPSIPYGNINAPTIMVAEKAADAILGHPPLSPAEVPVWIDPAWPDRQRPNTPQRPLEPNGPV